MDINLQVPIWTIEHIAAALHTSVDTAREHTYSATFPAPKAAFAKNLWERETVLVWFASLPTRDRRAIKRTTHTAKAEHLRIAKRSTTRPSTAGGAPATKPTIKSYKPRSPR